MRADLSAPWPIAASVLAAAMLLAGAQAAAASPATPPAAAALRAVRDADPLELARVARRYGDPAILALLAPEQPAATRLAAARAAPWLHEPEQALLPLCAMIVSRDSDLAPSAARAAWQIARALDPLVLARRELLPQTLVPALSALCKAADNASLRADLRLLAAAAAAQLHAAGVPQAGAPSSAPPR